MLITQLMICLVYILLVNFVVLSGCHNNTSSEQLAVKLVMTVDALIEGKSMQSAQYKS